MTRSQEEITLSVANCFFRAILAAAAGLIISGIGLFNNSTLVFGLTETILGTFFLLMALMFALVGTVMFTAMLVGIARSKSAQSFISSETPRDSETP